MAKHAWVLPIIMIIVIVRNQGARETVGRTLRSGQPGRRASRGPSRPPGRPNGGEVPTAPGTQTLFGPEGPSVRKRTVRNENTDENPTISTGRRRFCCGAGTNWPFVACNHGVQMPLDAACATAKDSCTQ